MQIRSNGLAQARSHPPSSESQPSLQPSTSLLTPPSSSVSEPQVASIAVPKRSRHSSLPHRLLSSLVPGNSTSAPPRTRTTSATQTSQRKKWRLSRRFSKTPVADDVAIHEVAEPQDEQNRTRDSAAEAESGKGKAREDESVDDFQTVPGTSSSSAPLEDATSTPSGSRFVEPASDIASQPIPSFSPHCSEEDEDEVVIAPTTESIDLSPQTQGVPGNQSEGPPSMFIPPLGHTGPQPSVGTTTQLPARQFPPAGTLVVVQGVVHTTDVSRASEANVTLANNNGNSSNPSFANDGNLEPPRIGRSPSISPSSPQRSYSTPRDRLRNRLSGILPRPTSMLPMSEGIASVGHPAADYPQQLPVDTQSSTATSNSGTGPPTSEFSSVNPGSLSPSSIDVLGTLLSVAAAATAASLLTGSSEPIFSSGLAPPPQSPTQPPQSMSDRPLSPTPTGDAGRMRHVWSSLRDRLGLRAPGMGVPGADESAGRPSPRDARELLLSEMARAFNLGLGVGSPPVVPGVANASGPTAPTPEAAAVNGDRNNDVPIVPPPGSFERFLIDLQSDLRVALAQQSVPVDADDEDEGDDDNHEDEDETTEEADVVSDSESYDTAASNIDDDMPELQSVSDEASTISDAHTARESPGTHGDNLGQGDDPNLDIRNAQGYDITATLPRAAHADTFSGDTGTGIGSQGASSGSPGALTERLPSSLSSGPPPGVGSSAETSTTAQDSSIETDMPFRIPRIFPGSPSRTEHTPINWWRLYRFPPITAPANRGTQASTIGQQGYTPQPHADSQGAQNAGAAPTVPSPLSSIPSGMPDTGNAMPDGELAGGVESGVESGDGNPNRNERNVVVPVIVVGLQSVNAERQPPMPPHPHHPHVHHHSPEFVDEHQTEGDLMDLDFGSESPMSPPMYAPGTPSEYSSEDTRQSRSRSWQSRAADAIRNLRPGRRAAVARQIPLEPPGSRTFLIYVIGGYYPPDHQIITGGNLDSFEALWELAEILGQVKPPTVSKDEIDKSGLEVIKAESLEEYEKDGRVASNCVERCLICLDDYVPDEDLRVLTCKHAFHQGCVDRWLQTGRNNCPACRSKGVSNDDDASPSNEPSASTSTTIPQPAAV